jgi:hypothetical protein
VGAWIPRLAREPSRLHGPFGLPFMAAPPPPRSRPGQSQHTPGRSDRRKIARTRARSRGGAAPVQKNTVVEPVTALPEPGAIPSRASPSRSRHNSICTASASDVKSPGGHSRSAVSESGNWRRTRCMTSSP